MNTSNPEHQPDTPILTRLSRRVPPATLFPGLDNTLASLPFITVFENLSKQDQLALPAIDPWYVFRNTPEMERVLHALNQPNLPCYLVGPTGCGKTTLVEQLCARTRRPVTRINLDSNLARGDFLGIWVFKEDQSMRFHHGPAAVAIRDGHVLILDEIDVATPGVLLLFQACLEGRPFKILETGETFAPHPDFRLFATANTLGRGDESLLYRATQSQNFALLDRFRWFLPISYPTPEEEIRILSARFGSVLSQEVYEKLAKTALEIREAQAKEECEVPLSTRVLISVAQDILTFNSTPMQAFQYCFLTRLGKAERELCEGLIGVVWGSAATGKVRDIFVAAAQGWLDEVRALLDSGFPVDSRNRIGATALMLAAQNGHLEVVNLLLERGADLNAQDTVGATALMLAAQNGHLEVVSLLRERGAKASTPTEGKPFTNSLGMEFVPIPAGKFWMGSADNDREAKDSEKPRHEVTISRPFHLGKYPVTQAQWQAVMGENPSCFKGLDRPVENVSWEDAQEFIAKLNALEDHERYRLPTEAEWEYACRAGSETAFSFGDDADKLEDYAWYRNNSGDETHPVGQKQPNAWGLYDMHGNVWEWVQDWYGDYSAGAVVDPRGPDGGEFRVLRGSCWLDLARICRSACRSRFRSDFRMNGVGLRLALSSGH